MRLIKGRGQSPDEGALTYHGSPDRRIVLKVAALLEALPGVGKVRRVQIMERLGIHESRRVRGLGAGQRQALEREFAAA